MFHIKRFSRLKNNPKILILTFLIFSLAVFTRLVFLGRIPAVFSHDEIGYVTNALSVFLTGTGKTGEWHPFSLYPVEPQLSELPTLFIAPFFYLPFSNVINARLASVIMSLTLPLLIAGICFELTRSKKTSYLSLIIALFNPWIWQNARFTFDVFFSLWFYTLGIFIFLKNKDTYKPLSLIPFFLGFYCYQGFKLLLPFIGIALFIFSIFKTNKPSLARKDFIGSSMFLFGILSIFIFYLINQFSAQETSIARINSQILLPGSERISSVVDNDRRLTINSAVNVLFINKYIQFSKEIIGKLMSVFGWRELFFEINAASTSFSVWNHGIFYLIDALFLFFGVLFLIKKKKYKIGIFLGALLLIGSIPALIANGLWLFFRSAFIIPFLIVIMGIGWNEILKRNKKIFIVTAIFYFIFVLNFSFNYFFRYSLFALEGIFFSPRIMSDYISRISPNEQIIIFDDEPEFSFTSYIFYNNLFSKQNARKIQEIYKSKDYAMNNVTFYQCVPNDFNPAKNVTYIFDVNIDYCAINNETEHTVIGPDFLQKSSLLYIKQIKDSGDNYVIYGDKVCENYNELEKFIHPQEFKDFNFKTLNDKDFCQIWLAEAL